MEQNKIIITFKDFLIQFKAALIGIPSLIKAKKSVEISDEFFERIMLAVTEVNGCALCSYEHSRLALEAGLSNEEIEMILSAGEIEFPENEREAILFAQHYAATKGNPTKKSLMVLGATYGSEVATQIIAVIKTIMVGNAYGIAYGTLKLRLKGDPVNQSSLKRELAILSFPALVVLAPVVFIFITIKLIVKYRH